MSATVVQHPLVKALLTKKRRERIPSVNAFAQRLGVTRELLRGPLIENEPPGITLLQAIVKAYPDLDDLVLDYLRGRNGNTSTGCR